MARRADITSKNGAYTKSVCEIVEKISYNEADKICQSKQMDLFVIDSTDVQSALIKFASQSSNDSIWINGRRDDYGVWSSFNPYRIPIFKGLAWTKEKSTGMCLSIILDNKSILASANSCGEAFKLFCEYRK